MVRPSSPTSSTIETFAYATFLSPPTSNNYNDSQAEQLGDPYFTSARLLNYQINHAEKTKTRLPGVPFLVLVLPEVPASQIAILEAEGATIVPIEPLDLPSAFDKAFIQNSRFRDVLSKLRLWELIQYSKLLYLDADTFLLANLDPIFTAPNISTPSHTLISRLDTDAGLAPPPSTYLMAASTDTHGSQLPWELEPETHPEYLCACFMLLSPSTQLFRHYIDVLNGPDVPDNAAYPEQDLLIWAHRRGGPMPWMRIPIEWSANDAEMSDVLALKGGVRSLHVKGWEGEGGNVAGEKYRGVWRGLVEEMEGWYGRGG